MNNPANIDIDVPALREWLVGHKADKGFSWTMLEVDSGIPAGTLSPWANGNYSAKIDTVAPRVLRYRQKVESQAAERQNRVSAGIDRAPGYIETPTGQRFRRLFMIAQAGAITVGATSPGTGKTTEMVEYAACVANVWQVTIDPTTRTLPAMVAEVARAVTRKPVSGWTRQLSQVVKDAARRGGLIIVDEANHLEFDALEQLRAWHDATGVGITLLGNEELLATIQNGNSRHSRHAFARLNRRIEYTHVQDGPQSDDIEAYLDAWSIDAPDQRAMLMRVGMTPGSGGLGEIKQIITNALLLAEDDGVKLSLSHLKDARAMRATRTLRVSG